MFSSWNGEDDKHSTQKIICLGVGEKQELQCSIMLTLEIKHMSKSSPFPPQLIWQSTFLDIEAHLGNERDMYSRVWLDEFDKHLGSDVS